MCLQNSAVMLLLSYFVDVNTPGILDRSLTQAQQLSQFLDVMIQLLNRGPAAVRLFAILMNLILTLTRSNRL